MKAHQLASCIERAMIKADAMAAERAPSPGRELERLRFFLSTLAGLFGANDDERLAAKISAFLSTPPSPGA